MTTTQEPGPSTKSTLIDETVEEVKEVFGGLAEKSGIPPWGMYCIVLRKADFKDFKETN